MQRVWAGLVTIVLCLSALAQIDSKLAEGLHWLEEGRTTLEVEPLGKAKDLFLALTQRESNNSANFYHLARVDSYLIDAYSRAGDKKQAERAVDDGITAVERAIQKNDKFADAHSLLADLYGRKIALGAGLMLGPRFGPKIAEENKKALALDDKSARVYASLGRQYLHAPKMFGGDVDKAIASFRKATELDPGFDENYVWLAVAYRQEQDAADAEQALQEALERNPRSAFAKWVQAGHSA